MVSLAEPSISVKQENHVVKGKCLPINLEVEEDSGGILVKQEHLDVITYE